MMASEQNNRTGWIAIPSVPPERAAQAFAAFYLAITAAIAIDVLLIAHNRRPETWQITAEMMFDDGGQIVAWALAATWPIMEAMRMVIARIMQKRTYQRGKNDANRLWREWLRRQEQAKARGEPFTEPAPDEADNGTALNGAGEQK